jgi:hypothetical protein
MSPAVIQEIQAAIQQLQQQMATSANASSGDQVVQGGSTFNWLQSGGQPVTLGTSTTVWRTLALSAFLPPQAKAAILTGYAYDASPDNKELEVRFRLPQGDTNTIRTTDIIATHSRSVAGTYSVGVGFGTVIVPMSNGSIQYCIYDPNDGALTGSFAALTINLIGYLA